MRIRTCMACIAWLFLSASAVAELSFGVAVDKAGEQRMLSQRIAQSYLLTLIQPESSKGHDRMLRAIDSFDRNLTVLQGYKRAASIAGELAEVNRLWRTYKALALSDVNVHSAERLLKESDELLAAAHRYVGLLEKLADTGLGEVVNIAGKQRMLSQRIAKNYFAYFQKLGGEERIKALYEDLAEYENVLAYLQQNPMTTAAIQIKLNKVEGQLTYASKGFDGLMQISGDRLIYVITGTTDAMLKNMDDVTKMYAALP